MSKHQDETITLTPRFANGDSLKIEISEFPSYEQVISALYKIADPDNLERLYDSLINAHEEINQ
jgi:hypothetical protein